VSYLLNALEALAFVPFFLVVIGFLVEVASIKRDDWE
jgi:hypothetical protein